ncbi:MAG: WecB/TagA/CpsF family glycosyltransferase [Planctomycetota bacterium]
MTSIPTPHPKRPRRATLASPRPELAAAPDAEQVLAYQVSAAGRARDVATVLGWVREPAQPPRARFFVCANPHSLQVARRDAAFDAAIHDADLVVPDGVGLVLASRLLGDQRIRQRVTGSALFHGVSRHLDAAGGRYFFLGSTEATLAAVRQRMAAVYPGIEVVGTLSPPFAPQFDVTTSAAMVEAVNRARPDVLWVGMTAPKQEKWIHAHRDELEVPVLAPIGAVFDYFTGRVQRPGPMFRRLGLEWLPRLMREPRRLWRRNAVSSPAFALRVVGQRLRRAGGRALPS